MQREEFYIALQKLKTGKAVGVDKIAGEIL